MGVVVVDVVVVVGVVGVDVTVAELALESHFVVIAAVAVNFAFIYTQILFLYINKLLYLIIYK